MKPIIKLVVLNVHMGKGHDGLSLVLRKQLKFEVSSLNPGEIVLCINRHGDKMKAIGGKGLVIGYLKLPHGQRIMRDALQYIPQTFGSTGFNYDEAVKHALDARFKTYPRHSPGPLETAKARKEAGL